MDEIEYIDFEDFSIAINLKNGNFEKIDSNYKENIDYVKRFLEIKDFYKEPHWSIIYNKDLLKTITISFHASSQCNLSCTYCFKKKRNNAMMTFPQAKSFIDMIIMEFPKASKFIVDPTGSGEPLLNLELIMDIANYCKTKSDDIEKEIIILMATNGTLLTEEIIYRLQDAGIIFGISLDGDKKVNDAYRKDRNGNGVHKTVIKNIKKIRHREFLGVAATLTDKNIDLVKSVKHLSRYFPTVSIKPVRSKSDEGGITNNNINDIIDAYTRLFDFLLQETLNNKLYYIKSLLRGDDYFGKYLFRTLIGIKYTTRCDAGIARFSMDETEKIYACPASVDDEDFIIGTLESGLYHSKIMQLWSVLNDRSKCDGCYAKFLCGGECMVVSKMLYGKIDLLDPTMCKFKRHLSKLAYLFTVLVQDMNPVLYMDLANFCINKLERESEKRI